MSLHPEDRKAGFTGLIVAVVVLLVTVYGVVLLTNRKFETHSEAAATH